MALVIAADAEGGAPSGEADAISEAAEAAAEPADAGEDADADEAAAAAPNDAPPPEAMPESALEEELANPFELRPISLAEAFLEALLEAPPPDSLDDVPDMPPEDPFEVGEDEAAPEMPVADPPVADAPSAPDPPACPERCAPLETPAPDDAAIGSGVTNGAAAAK